MYFSAMKGKHLTQTFDKLEKGGSGTSLSISGSCLRVRVEGSGRSIDG